MRASLAGALARREPAALVLFWPAEIPGYRAVELPPNEGAPHPGPFLYEREP